VVTGTVVGRDLATIPPLRIPRERRAECFGRDDRFVVGAGAVTKTAKNSRSLHYAARKKRGRLRSLG